MPIGGDFSPVLPWMMPVFSSPVIGKRARVPTDI